MFWKWIERQKNDAIAKQIKACFDDVDWNQHSFNIGGAMAENTHGDKLFYPVREIDAAIERLNKVLKELSA